MKLGELFINIATKGDTKELDKALAKLKSAEKETRRQIKYRRDLAKATSDEEKELVKKNYEQQQEIEKLQDVKDQQVEVNQTIKNGITSAIKWTTAIAGAVIVLDRLGNSLLKANQLYINFTNQTGMSIASLNRMAGVGRLASMNMSAEQVASDLTSLQQKIFQLGLTGEGSGIFAQLGMNPIGMNPEQFINALRNRTQGLTGEQKTYILDQLGLSREWINVLELSTKDYNEFLSASRKLQLSEKERKDLAKYTAIQQRNNMKFELAKQKFLIHIMPIVTKIVEKFDDILLVLTDSKWETFVSMLTKASLLLGVMAIHSRKIRNSLALATIGGVTAGAGGAVSGGLLGLLGLGAGKQAGKMFGKQAGKLLAKRAATMGATAIAGTTSAAPTGGFGAIIALIIEVGLAVWTIYDLCKLFFTKEENREAEKEEPIEAEQLRIANRQMYSNMTNNFYNNPQPVASISREIDYMNSRFLAETRI